MPRKTKLIQTSFLIPLYEDEDIGNNKLHPTSLWVQFQRKLYAEFGAWTLAPGGYKGIYKDPRTGMEVTDISRKYILAIQKKDLKRLKEFLKREVVIFRQKWIYLEASGKVELLEVKHEKNL